MCYELLMYIYSINSKKTNGNTLGLFRVHLN